MQEDAHRGFSHPIDRTHSALVYPGQGEKEELSLITPHVSVLHLYRGTLFLDSLNRFKPKAWSNGIGELLNEKRMA